MTLLFYSTKKNLWYVELIISFKSLLYFGIDIGADILDSTNQNVFAFGTLEEEDTWFELAPEQRSYFDYLQHYNSYLREEFHALSVIIGINISFLCVRL